MKVLFLWLANVVAFKPPLCINCIHFKKDVHVDAKFGKCGLFPMVIEQNDYLITGVKSSVKIDYQYCSLVRNYKCGEEGKLFVPLS